MAAEKKNNDEVNEDEDPDHGSDSDWQTEEERREVRRRYRAIQEDLQSKSVVLST